MPTLFRFVVTLLVLAGLAYGAMFALVLFVEPKKAEISVRIPPARLDPSTKPGSSTTLETSTMPEPAQ